MCEIAPVTTPAIELRAVSKSFSSRRDGTVHAATDISLSIAPGQVYGLIGHNGAGKTTLIKMMCGLVTPTRGTVLIHGLDIQKQRSKALPYIGAVLEGTRNVYWRFTPLQNLRYFAGLNGKRWTEVRARSDGLLKELQLWDHRDRRVGLLSRGMQQKVAIACALVADPNVILLDEPTLGLDFESSQTVKGWIGSMARDRGVTVLLTTHQLDLAQELCDRVGIMHQGQLVIDANLSELVGNAASPTVELVVREGSRSTQEESLEESFADWTVTAGEDGTVRLRGDVETVGGLEKSVERAKAFGVIVESATYPRPTLQDVYVSLGRSDE